MVASVLFQVDVWSLASRSILPPRFEFTASGGKWKTSGTLRVMSFVDDRRSVISSGEQSTRSDWPIFGLSSDQPPREKLGSKFIAPPPSPTLPCPCLPSWGCGPILRLFMPLHFRRGRARSCRVVSPSEWVCARITSVAFPSCRRALPLRECRLAASSFSPWNVFVQSLVPVPTICWEVCELSRFPRRPKGTPQIFGFSLRLA